ncbi:hypothetical protein SAMN04489727_1699 [Amycolatopsis tolypomycina]|uniref:Uncharacterized protein n=1 Tax=Amycolatopsis tolypomycina TaxID=208445 RepID=A0A1H4JAN3_9PSEU|nr:hypothetical protein [Amycolatopsis tolypomycina]SEB43281.1 hypothetical protein SAMN04489727_1699 [Amycolatopsis tolypomycina]
MTAPAPATPAEVPDGAEFVTRQRALHVCADGDPWCSCGLRHCGMRVLLDHLDHAEATIAAALAALLRGGQAHGDVRRAAIAVLQGKPIPIGEVR